MGRRGLRIEVGNAMGVNMQANLQNSFSDPPPPSSPAELGEARSRAGQHEAQAYTRVHPCAAIARSSQRRL